MALGSTYELETQLHLARDLGYHQSTNTPESIAELIRVLTGLIRSLRHKSEP
jgi:four helix bundle protein